MIRDQANTHLHTVESDLKPFIPMAPLDFTRTTHFHGPNIKPKDQRGVKEISSKWARGLNYGSFGLIGVVENFPTIGAGTGGLDQYFVPLQHYINSKT